MYYSRMKQKHLSLMVFGMVLLLFIAGCKGREAAGGAPTTPFLGGTQGLEIGFLEGSPPDEVTDGDNFPFNAIVRLKNLGEYKFDGIDQIKVSLAGFLPNDFRSDAADFTDANLQDKNPAEVPTPKQRDSEGNIIEAIETIMTFPKDNKDFKYKGSVAGNTNFVFKADVCYKYQTKSVSEICVLNNLIDVADDAICKPSETKTVFSSGSPIKVTSFRQSVVGKDKIQFSFDVEHSGQGNVFDIMTDSDAAAKAKDSAQEAVTDAGGLVSAVTETSDLINSFDDTTRATNKWVTAKESVNALSVAATSAKAKAETANTDAIAAAADPTKAKLASVATSAQAAATELNDAINKAVDAIVKITAIATTETDQTTIKNNALTKANEAKESAEKAKAAAMGAFTYATAAAADCPRASAQRRTKEDTIKVTVDTGLAAKVTGTTTDSLSCPVLAATPSGATTAIKTGSVKLVNGKRTITCTQDLSSYTSDFKRSIDITIDFNYLDGISKNVLVKHLVTS